MTGTLTKTGQNSQGGHGLNDVSIAVIGSAGVGKSTFMQRSLDLKAFPRSPITSKKVSLEGSISVVRLIELDVTEISIIDDALRWPKVIDGYPVPRIDGLLLLYDVLNYATFDALPAVLGNKPHPQSPDLKLRFRLLTRTDVLEEDTRLTSIFNPRCHCRLHRTGSPGCIQMRFGTQKLGGPARFAQQHL